MSADELVELAVGVEGIETVGVVALLQPALDSGMKDAAMTGAITRRAWRSRIAPCF